MYVEDYLPYILLIYYLYIAIYIYISYTQTINYVLTHEVRGPPNSALLLA